ncbi:CorA family divalent cation transporter [Globicatella sulfidifaciens]
MEGLPKKLSDVNVEIITLKEFHDKYRHLMKDNHFFDLSKPVKHTKIYDMSHYAYGALFLPKIQQRSEQSCYFYLDDARFIIIEEHDWMKGLLNQIANEINNTELTKPIQVLLMIIEKMIYSQEKYLYEIEEKLDQQEESMLNNDGEYQPDLDHEFHKYGRDLLAFKRYYQQLSEFCDLLDEYFQEIVKPISRKKLQYLSLYAKRLKDDALDLREYVMQLREIYNADVSNKQNQTMQILTVVTTVFAPLTLLTGWYGMNFKHIPELEPPISYPILIMVVIGIVIFEVYMIKKKKWLN